MTEAQRLAAELDAVPENGADPELIADAAAELRRLEAENDALQAKLRRSEALCREWAVKAATWMASPEAAQRLDGYRELAQQVNRLEAECEQLHFELELCGQLKRGYQEQAAQAMAECEQLRADAARLAYLFKHDSEWALFVFEHDGGYWIHDARTPDVVRADIDAAMKETK